MILWPNGVCEVIKEWNKMDEIDHKRVEWDMVCVCVLGMLESLWKKIENKGSRVSRLFRTKVDGLVCF